MRPSSLLFLYIFFLIVLSLLVDAAVNDYKNRFQFNSNILDTNGTAVLTNCGTGANNAFNTTDYKEGNSSFELNTPSTANAGLYNSTAVGLGWTTGNHDRTICLWEKLLANVTVSDDNGVITTGQLGTRKLFEQGIDHYYGTSRMTVYLYGDDAYLSPDKGAASTTIITPRVWYHICTAYSAANKSITVYQNGVYNNSYTFAGNSALADTAVKIGVAACGNGPSIRLDDIRFYDRYISAAEANAIMYDNGSGSNTAPTITTENTFTNSTAGHSFTVYANATDANGASDITQTNISSTNGTCINILNTSSGNVFGSLWNCSGTVFALTNIVIGFLDSASNYVASANSSNVYPNQAPSISTENTFLNATTGHWFTVYANITDSDSNGISDIKTTNISSTSGSCVNILNTSSGTNFGSKWNCSGTAKALTNIVIGFIDKGNAYIASTNSSNAYPDQPITITTENTFINSTTGGHWFLVYANATDTDGASDVTLTNISANSGTCTNILNTSNGNVFGSKWNCSGTALTSTNIIIGFRNVGNTLAQTTLSSNTCPNQIPSLTGVTLNSTNFNIADNLYCNQGTGVDADGDSLTYSYAWFINGVDISYTLQTFYTQALAIKGDNITCQETASDNYQTNSTNVSGIVQNYIPIIFVDLGFINASAGHSFIAVANATDMDLSTDIKATNISTTSGSCANIYNSSSGNVFGSKWNCTGSALATTTITIGFTDLSNAYLNTNTKTNTYPNQPPSVIINSPIDNYHSNLNLTVNYTYSDVDTDSGTCYLYINNTLNITNNTVSSGNSIIALSTGINLEGNYSWKVNCSDSNANNITDTRYFILDLTAPSITWTNPANDNTSKGTSNLTLNILGSDSYLWSMIYWINYSNSTLLFTRNVTGLTPTDYTINDQINFTYGGTNLYRVATCFEDSHTATTFETAKNVIINVTDKSLTFKLNQSDITIKFLNTTNKNFTINSINTPKLTDRYVFNFTTTSNSSKTESYYFRVTSTQSIYIVPKSNYKGHIVIGRAYWLDFNNPTINATINKINDYIVDVKITSASGKDLVFSSLGGLNEWCEMRTYLYDPIYPTYSGLSNNATATTKYGDNVNWQATLADNYNLSHYIFGANTTGVWINTTLNYIPGTSRLVSNTRQVIIGRDKSICGQFYFNDSLNNKNETTLSCFTVANTMPYKANLSNPTNNSVINITWIWLNYTSGDIDNDNITYYIFLNTSQTYNQPNITTTSNSTNLSSIKWNTQYYWKVIASDLTDNGTSSDEWTFYINDSEKPAYYISINRTNPINWTGQHDVSVVWNASDNNIITNSYVNTTYLNGTFIQQNTSSPVILKNLSVNNYRLIGYAFDGQQENITQLDFNITDQTPPSIYQINFTAPLNCTGDSFNITANVSDDLGVTSVTYTLLKSDLTTPTVQLYLQGSLYSSTYNLTATLGLYRLLNITATDINGNTATSNTTNTIILAGCGPYTGGGQPYLYLLGNGEGATPQISEANISNETAAIQALLQSKAWEISENIVYLKPDQTAQLWTYTTNKFASWLTLKFPITNCTSYHLTCTVIRNESLILSYEIPYENKITYDIEDVLRFRDAEGRINLLPLRIRIINPLHFISIPEIPISLSPGWIEYFVVLGSPQIVGIRTWLVILIVLITFKIIRGRKNESPT